MEIPIRSGNETVDLEPVPTLPELPGPGIQATGVIKWKVLRFYFTMVLLACNDIYILYESIQSPEHRSLHPRMVNPRKT